MSKFEKVMASNPFLFAKIQKEEGSRQNYRLKDGKKVYFQSCKISEVNGMWNAIPWDVFNSIDFYCLKIEEQGYLFIPISRLRYFASFGSFNPVRFDIHINISASAIEFVPPRGKENIDIREYYHSL